MNRTTMKTLHSAEHGAIWRYFSAISAIPRPSKHEERIRDYLVSHAETRGWTVARDNVGNICCTVPGSGRGADTATLVLQAHMDMVCEKNGNVRHDFMKDPLQLRVDGDWVTAEGTTLGADNGMAIALMLALADNGAVDRIPLELLFTIDEETGLTGAMDFDPDIVNGRMLLNLDGEEDTMFIIGCAGGADLLTTFPVRAGTSEGQATAIAVTGLRGGHSGVNIHENRGNAIRIAAQIAKQLRDRQPKLVLHSIDGGNKKNAIPRECRMVVSGCDAAAATGAAAGIADDMQSSEPDIRIAVEGVARAPNVVLSAQALSFLITVPNGVIAMDPHFPEIVQTSSSIGVANTDRDGVHILIHGRSSATPALSKLSETIRAAAQRYDGTFEAGARYPGWSPNPDSELLRRSKRIYRDISGSEPTVCGIHAGLETGIIGGKLKSGELLSFGPNIRDPHSPDERVSIASTERVYHFLEALTSQPITADSS